MTTREKGLKKAGLALFGGGAAFGVLFLAGLFLTAGFSVMGVENQNVSNIVKDRFSGEIIRFLLGLLGIQLLLGTWFALPAATLKRASFLLGFFSSLLSGLGFFAFAAGYRPALYSAWLYDRGGPAAALQVFLAENPFWGLLLIAPVFVLVAYRAGRERNVAGFAALALVGFFTWAAVFNYPLDRTASPPASTEKPDILIISADSLRPDRIGCYGGKKSIAPNLSRLCEEGTMFEEAFVPTARTFPSWASLLSGQPPWVHGIRTMFPDPKEATLPESLPRWLAKGGYVSAVFSDYAGDIFPRFDAGFDIVDAPPFNFKTLVRSEVLGTQKFLLPFLDTPWGRKIAPLLDSNAEASDARHLTDKVLAYLSKEADRPRFTVVFYSTTHFPFSVTYPDVGKFSDPGYRGPFRFKKSPSLNETDLSNEDRRQIQALFDTCVYATDRHMGRLINAVRKAPGGRDTIILVTSDHGENLYEVEGDLGHGDHFRSNRTIKVPLILNSPDRVPHGLRLLDLVSLIDVAPTLAALAGVKTPDNLRGKNLMELARGGEPPHERLFFETGLWFVRISEGYLGTRRIPYPDISTMGQIDFGGDTSVSLKPEYLDITNIAKHRMVYDGRYKLVYIPTPRGIRWELFDLLYDPGEKTDLAGENPELLRRLSLAIIEEMGSAPNTEVRRDFFLPKKVAR